MAAPEETALRLLTAFQKLNDRTVELQREVEVLTQERNNALQSVETLQMQVSVLTSQAQEAELLEAERDNALLERDRAEGALAEYVTEYGEYRGGVHPNA